MNGWQEKVIDKAMSNDDKLNSWECDFIESLNDKGSDYELSFKENKKLNEISEKVY